MSVSVYLLTHNSTDHPSTQCGRQCMLKSNQNLTFTPSTLVFIIAADHVSSFQRQKLFSQHCKVLGHSVCPKLVLIAYRHGGKVQQAELELVKENVQLIYQTVRVPATMCHKMSFCVGWDTYRSVTQHCVTSNQLRKHLTKH